MILRRNFLLICVALSFSFSSCSHRTSDAVVASGGMLGGLFGSMIGQIVGGDNGSGIGECVGAVAGTTAGVAVSQRNEKRRERERRRTQEDADYEYLPGEYDNTEVPTITNVRYKGKNGLSTITPGIDGSLYFDFYNRTGKTLYDVQPQIISSTTNVKLSASAGIIKMSPNVGIRYRAMLLTNKRLKPGVVSFKVKFYGRCVGTYYIKVEG